MTVTMLSAIFIMGILAGMVLITIFTFEPKWVSRWKMQYRIRRHQWRAVEGEYCTRCGTPLVLKPRVNQYLATTGEPVYADYVWCAHCSTNTVSSDQRGEDYIVVNGKRKAVGKGWW
jgi:hypothetical protein